MKNWLRKRHQKKHEATQARSLYELREFIYLDEVSVTSLLSSREGAIPQEFTDTAGSTSTAELNAEVDASVAVLKSKVGSRYESVRNADSQVVSKATVQTLFKRLFDIEEGRLALRSSLSLDRLPSSSVLDELVASNQFDPPNRCWVTPAEKLKRGELVELEVELETDEVFQLSTILATFKELSDEHEDLRAQLGEDRLKDLVSINRVIERLMVGLIPLKCRVVNYFIAETQYGEKLIHRDAYEGLEFDSRPPVTQLYMVGDTEQSLYWKDIRRVLFTGSRFRMLCRLNSDGLNASWKPLKLTNVLEKVDPDLGSRLAFFGAWSAAAVTGPVSAPTKIEERRAGALQAYGELLASHASYVLSPEDLSTLSVLAQAGESRFNSALHAPEAFKPVRDLVEGLAATSFDPETAARLREEACENSGFLPDGSLIQSEQVIPTDASVRAPEHLLDVEVVAIYW